MTKKFLLKPGSLSLQDIRLLKSDVNLVLDDACVENIQQSQQTVQDIIASGQTIYGVNTGFGKLANKTIDAEQLQQLQHNLILSHCAATGELFSDGIVRLIILLKINSLARGFSGTRIELINALIALFNHHVYPCIPSKGSVGASGDLAPLAHLSAVLLGHGEAHYKAKKLPAKKALSKAGLKPFTLQPKEGLALVNGTQVSTALAIEALFQLENIFKLAIHAGCLTMHALAAHSVPFNEEIQIIRGQQGQIDVAKTYRKLLLNCPLYNEQNPRVQDPYSIRCQPQVMGACLDQMRFASTILEREANAVSDNPLVFVEQQQILSGGNFHAEPVAMVADNLALAIAEIGALAERRIAVLINSNWSGLPSFLVEDSGLNSGFMIPQVTAAALASENKSLAHPACVDSLSTSANQEDHVSMATFAARRLFEMLDNTLTIVSIELLAACQGMDLRQVQCHSPELQETYQQVRKRVTFYDKDRSFSEDIDAVKNMKF